MWFRKRQTLEESGFFRGFTDWHSHILPGVDDGVQSMDESLQILAEYERLGVKEVWLTPHIMEDIPNTTEKLRDRFMELKAAYQGSIVLNLASENMLDNLFEERLEKNDLLPIGKDGKHLLVETSYFNPPMGLNNILLRIKAKGYYPVLAHLERYLYMSESFSLINSHFSVYMVKRYRNEPRLCKSKECTTTSVQTSIKSSLCKMRCASNYKKNTEFTPLI
jgi:tyrosine-protein phosphatase YwqE